MTWVVYTITGEEEWGDNAVEVDSTTVDALLAALPRAFYGGDWEVALLPDFEVLCLDDALPRCETLFVRLTELAPARYDGPIRKSSFDESGRKSSFDESGRGRASSFGRAAPQPEPRAAQQPSAYKPSGDDEDDGELDFQGQDDDDDDGYSRPRADSEERPVRRQPQQQQPQQPPPRPRDEPAAPTLEEASETLRRGLGGMKSLLSKGLDFAKVAAVQAAKKVDEAMQNSILQNNLQSAMGSKMVEFGSKRVWVGRVLDKERGRESYLARDADDAAVEYDLCIITCTKAVEVRAVKREIAILEKLSQVRLVQPLISQQILREDKIMTVLLLRPLFQHSVMDTLRDYLHKSSVAEERGEAAPQNPWLESRAARLFVGTALALRHLHELNVAHLDVCPRSILLSPDGKPVLARLRHARDSPEIFETDEAASAFADSMPMSDYHAPELRHVIQGSAVDAAADVYAFGATMFHVAFGEAPTAPPRFPRNHAHGGVSFSGEYVDVISKAMHPDPQRRPAFADLLPKLRGL
ncbi:kinase-like domain-containing protein [Pelagophyceae sp. CCMP2097]|nr:kinase-like domain-containing protein [Pelagophyceae sp. CCMP2097]|mmetsp:Transcript_3861/g.14133  ORF Transcript_3861/g.14133 Transcript_3861/m.14133 type:complete len:525 (+) Transcript_3861:119-1693(+)|eukprot:CAMPEP_0184088098 /NCGR_PEP_ID=MMETSP0974-20121125/6051_1 /TAXON_ID=483370 /ORGANISM="non described non described, Strain CCMP2097" /LENGTH=524 /DNA_ID=CAMNT_0026390803 /DNA_START=73 /DNA_END=1647 /DNA_ORIENTATION=-